MVNTKIEWTDHTWNPFSGCQKISQGCKFCYAEVIAERFRGGVAFPDGFDYTERPKKLNEPLTWKEPSLIFVNSMSDLFWEKARPEYLHQIFDVIEKCPHHKFQILTKRPEHALTWASEVRPFPDNVWMGVSVENKDTLHRIDTLRAIEAKTRFISFEPLLERLGAVNLSGVHWAIVGGESGNGARPMHPQWVRSLRDQCEEQNVAFFFKQWGEWVVMEQLSDEVWRSINFPRLQHQTIKDSFENVHISVIAFNVGKGKAGNLLDGVQHLNYPNL